MCLSRLVLAQILSHRKLMPKRRILSTYPPLLLAVDHGGHWGSEQLPHDWWQSCHPSRRLLSKTPYNLWLHSDGRMMSTQNPEKWVHIPFLAVLRQVSAGNQINSLISHPTGVPVFTVDVTTGWFGVSCELLDSDTESLKVLITGFGLFCLSSSAPVSAAVKLISELTSANHAARCLEM